MEGVGGFGGPEPQFNSIDVTLRSSRPPCSALRFHTDTDGAHRILRSWGVGIKGSLLHSKEMNFK